MLRGWGVFSAIIRANSDPLRRCLPLLREHQRRDELLELSIDAGDSASARGAHEVSIGLLYPAVIVERVL